MPTMHPQLLALAHRVLGLPADLELINGRGKVMTRARLHADGGITDLGPGQHQGVTFPCPSLLRHNYHGPSRPTYRYLRYINPNSKLHGQTLHALGIHR